MRNSIGANQYKFFLVAPIYYLSMGLGLIGTKLAVIAILGIPIIANAPEAIYYIKHKKIRSLSLNQLIYKSSWFIPSIKHSLIVGLLSGITAHLFLYIGIEYSAFVILFSMIYYVIYISDV